MVQKTSLLHVFPSEKSLSSGKIAPQLGLWFGLGLGLGAILLGGNCPRTVNQIFSIFFHWIKI